jgi:hypothetical protein
MVIQIFLLFKLFNYNLRMIKRLPLLYNLHIANIKKTW